MAFIRYVATVVWWSAVYAVRPYDVVADRRRWFWQRRAKCGFQSMWENGEL